MEDLRKNWIAIKRWRQGFPSECHPHNEHFQGEVSSTLQKKIRKKKQLTAVEQHGKVRRPSAKIIHTTQIIQNYCVKKFKQILIFWIDHFKNLGTRKPRKICIFKTFFYSFSLFSWIAWIRNAKL